MKTGDARTGQQRELSDAESQGVPSGAYGFLTGSDLAAGSNEVLGGHIACGFELNEHISRLINSNRGTLMARINSGVINHSATVINRREVLKAIPAVGLTAGLLEGFLNGKRRTTISIEGDRFLINGRPTYEGRSYRGMKVEGLLMNSRMVNGIFDDMNSSTRSFWNYPDTGNWDPERNTREFVSAMPVWRKYGLLSFTLNLQGGRPRSYPAEQPWHNSAFEGDGALRKAYLRRARRILEEADILRMAPILGCFYFGQDQRLRDEAAVIRGLEEVVTWVGEKGYRNVLLEINNECDNGYNHAILGPDRVHQLIERAKALRWRGERFLVGTSFGGGTIPPDNVVAASDFVLLHGNGTHDPTGIAGMVDEVRRLPSYRPKPILFNEDQACNFDQPNNNMLAAVGSYASWGFLDVGANNYRDGYQSPPVNWGINTMRKQAFFGLLREMTGS